MGRKIEKPVFLAEAVGRIGKYDLIEKIDDGRLPQPRRMDGRYFWPRRRFDARSAMTVEERQIEIEHERQQPPEGSNGQDNPPVTGEVQQHEGSFDAADDDDVGEI
jgi:hypothetical protein